MRRSVRNTELVQYAPNIPVYKLLIAHFRPVARLGVYVAEKQRRAARGL